MTSTPTPKRGRVDRVAPLAILSLLLVKIWLDRQWPGSLAHLLLGYANMVLVLAWFGSKVWTGYRRRLPYWTRESWIRYARLAVMPFLGLVLLFTELYFFDNRATGGVFGSPQSTLRMVWVLIDLTLMGLGTVGMVMAIDWLGRGEPSEQFTRTRWFRRPRTSAIAD